MMHPWGNIYTFLPVAKPPCQFDLPRLCPRGLKLEGPSGLKLMALLPGNGESTGRHGSTRKNYRATWDVWWYWWSVDWAKGIWIQLKHIETKSRKDLVYWRTRLIGNLGTFLAWNSNDNIDTKLWVMTSVMIYFFALVELSDFMGNMEIYVACLLLFWQLRHHWNVALTELSHSWGTIFWKDQEGHLLPKISKAHSQALRAKFSNIIDVILCYMMVSKGVCTDFEKLGYPVYSHDKTSVKNLRYEYIWSGAFCIIVRGTRGNHSVQ